MLISHPPLPENGPDDEPKFVEDEDDEEEIPSADSPRDEVEEEDEVEEPARKKRKLPIRGESATVSSPARGVADEEAVATSPGAQSSGGWEEPLNVPPVASAAPRSFARMPSPSLSSFDDTSSPRLVSLQHVPRVVLLRVRRLFDCVLDITCSHHSGNVGSPLRDTELTSGPSTGLETPVVVEKVHVEANAMASSSRVPPSAVDDLELLDHVSLLLFSLFF